METAIIWTALGIYGAGRIYDKWVEDFGRVTPLGVGLCVVFAVTGPFAVGVSVLLAKMNPTRRWG